MNPVLEHASAVNRSRLEDRMSRMHASERCGECYGSLGWVELSLEPALFPGVLRVRVLALLLTVSGQANHSVRCAPTCVDGR